MKCCYLVQIPLLFAVSTAFAAPTAELTLGRAVETALAQSPAVLASAQDRLLAHGTRRRAAAPFDWTLDLEGAYARDELPIGADLAVATEAGSSAAAVFKRFRWGTTVSPVVRLVHTSADSDLIGRDAANTADVAIEVVQPLLRGAFSAAHAPEDAAAMFADAAEQTYVFVMSSVIRDVAVTYWSYRAAHEQLRVLEESERRMQRLLAQSQTLADNDQIPAADLVQIRATAAQRESARVAAQLAVARTRTALGITMGLSPEATAQLGTPTTPFPAAKSPVAVTALLGWAETRGDVRAARRQADAFGRLTVAADNGVLPAVDVVLGAGYAGRRESLGFGGYVGALGRTPGANVSAALRVSWNLSNAEGRGRQLEAQAQQQRAGIVFANTLRIAETNISFAHEAVTKSRQVLDLADRSAKLYRESVDNESQKLAAGLSTVIDVILAEDRYNAAELALVANQPAYASAVVNLRFETGTLITVDAGAARVRAADLTNTPEAKR